MPRTAEDAQLANVLIGFTSMGVATILFLIPLVLAALWLKRRKTDKHISSVLIGAALLLLGVIGGTSPCWIHNYFIARDPVFLSAHSGINFWIGNNPGANGYPRFPPGLRAGQAAMLEDSISVAESAAGVVTPVASAELADDLPPPGEAEPVVPLDEVAYAWRPPLAPPRP